ncbi:MAG: polymerase sigma-70 factor, subfamily [Acidimicrobiaceae bacterium]
MTPETSDLPIERARAGDSEALEAVYRALHPPVFAYLRSFLPYEDAEDAASDVFIAVARGLSAFEGSKPAFRSWVFTIAHHKGADVCRRQRRRRTHTVAPGDIAHAVPGGDAEDDALEIVGTDSTLVHISGLPAAQAEVLLLRIVADLPYADIARILGKRQEAVRALQLRALRRLARQFAEREVAS